jgi:thiamine pyrophosphokinase
MLTSCDVVICCDGAVVPYLNYCGHFPDYVVGDMDSIPPSVKKAVYGNMGTHVVEMSDQETNDLTKSFGVALELGPAGIHIFGATGKREDHTLANVSLLPGYVRIAADRGCSKVDMVSDFGIFIVCSDTCSVKCRANCEVSLFSFDVGLHIHAEGLMYPTDGVIFDELWKGSLNVAVSDHFELIFNHPSALIVYIAE